MSLSVHARSMQYMTLEWFWFVKNCVFDEKLTQQNNEFEKRPDEGDLSKVGLSGIWWYCIVFFLIRKRLPHLLLMMMTKTKSNPSSTYMDIHSTKGQANSDKKKDGPNTIYMLFLSNHGPCLLFGFLVFLCGKTRHYVAKPVIMGRLL